MKNKAGKIALGAAVAAAAGYVAGILTAPKSGKETRQDIKNAAVKAKQEAEKRLKTLHSELDDLLGQAKKNAKKLQQGAASEYAKVVAKAQAAKQKAKELLSAIHEGDVEDKDLQQVIKEVENAANHLKDFLKKSKPSKSN